MSLTKEELLENFPKLEVGTVVWFDQTYCRVADGGHTKYRESLEWAYDKYQHARLDWSFLHAAEVFVSTLLSPQHKGTPIWNESIKTTVHAMLDIAAEIQDELDAEAHGVVE